MIPKAARDTFCNLKEGDSLVVLGDDAEGIALIKSVDFENKIQEAMRLSQQKAEEKRVNGGGIYEVPELWKGNAKWVFVLQ